MILKDKIAELIDCDLFFITLAIFRIYLIILGNKKKMNKWPYMDQ